MEKKDQTKDFSRRKFIQGMGAGLAGGYALVGSLKAGAPEGSGQVAEADAGHRGKVPLSLEVNGRLVRLLVEPRTTLAEVLREELGLTGTKVSCNRGECGTCTVLLDGKAVYACHTLALDAADRQVTTIEGLLAGEKLHPIQEAFLEKDGFQCGFCTPGQIMAAQALLRKTPQPTREQILEGLSGNICRCGAYPHIIESVLAAAKAAGR